MNSSAANQEQRGTRLGIDVGSVRIGVAASASDGSLVVPVETVARAADGSDLQRIADLGCERSATAMVVGLPRGLSGAEGPAAVAAREYAARLAARVAPVPVRLVDERLTTVSAARNLRQSGVRGKKGRSVIDQAAAVELLRFALDIEARTGEPAGELVQALPSGDSGASGAPA